MGYLAIVPQYKCETVHVPVQPATSLDFEMQTSELRKPTELNNQSMFQNSFTLSKFTM